MIYFMWVIPLMFSILAVKKDYLIYKASVTLSCIGICVYAFMQKGNLAFFLIMAAFIFSIIGDVFLSKRKIKSNFYLYGVIGFFLAHVFYLLFMMHYGRINIFILIILLILYIYYFIRRLYPALKDKKMMIAIILYTIISCLTLASTVGLTTNIITKILCISGIFLILISDTFIGEVDFAKNKKFIKLILPTYYLAHILLAYSFVYL